MVHKGYYFTQFSTSFVTEKIDLYRSEKFKTLTLFDSNIISIESVIDSDDNEAHNSYKSL